MCERRGYRCFLQQESHCCLQRNHAFHQHFKVQCYTNFQVIFFFTYFLIFRKNSPSNPNYHLSPCLHHPSKFPILFSWRSVEPPTDFETPQGCDVTKGQLPEFMKLKVAFFYTTGGLESPSRLRDQLLAPVRSRSFTNLRRCLPLWAPLHPQSEEMYQQPLQQCQEARVRVAADPGGLSARPLRDDPSHTWGSSRPTAPTNNFGFVAPNKQTAPIVKPPFKFPQKIVLSLSVVGLSKGREDWGFPHTWLNYYFFIVFLFIFLWMICISPHSFSFKMTVQYREGSTLPVWSSFPSASFSISLH